MNIEKADYGTIVKFGTLKDLHEKIKIKNDNVADIINWVDDSGISLLERSLISRKFEISKFLLDNNAKVNIVSKEGNNEFHFLAPNINCIEAVEIGKLLELPPASVETVNAIIVKINIIPNIIRPINNCPLAQFLRIASFGFFPISQIIYITIFTIGMFTNK